MKRIYQKITIKGNELKQNVRLRTDYSKVIGLLFTLNKNMDMDAYAAFISNSPTVSLRIGGKEVLPIGTDLSLFLHTPALSRKDVLFELREEDGIEANGQLAEVEITDRYSALSATDEVNLYLLLYAND